MKWFSPKWIDEWIKSYISDGSVEINANDEVGPFFQTKKELRQGDPLSKKMTSARWPSFTHFFNIVADMCALFINRAKEED